MSSLIPPMKNSINNSRAKISRRKEMVLKKLAIKRELLQLLEDDLNLENNVGKIEDINEKVYKALESMTSGELFDEMENTEKNFDRYTKAELVALVSGFRKLIVSVSLTNKKLRSRVRKEAQNIRSLQNFPIFTENNLNKNKNFNNRKYGRKNQRNNVCELSDKDIERAALIKEVDRKPMPSPAESFANYINQMLHDYLEKHQPDNIEKYKCLPSHIEDLEPLASALVKEGYGCIVETKIRINRKNNNQAFISISTDKNSCEEDGFINLPVARRYAFEGDTVRAFVLNPDEGSNNLTKTPSKQELFDETDVLSSSESEINDTLGSCTDIIPKKQSCRKAFIIKIIKQTELREVAGCIKLHQPIALNAELYYELKPHDARMPNVFILKKSCEQQTKGEDKYLDGWMCIARVLDVDSNGICIGELVELIGKASDVASEIKAILYQNGILTTTEDGIDDEKYSDIYDENKWLPLTNEHLKDREDLRKICTFSIDPDDAVDCDDAVSVEKLNDFEYQIGVHIADVSFYLKENSELDNVVQQRTTSVYTVDSAFHMLPYKMCNLLSLDFEEDRLTFSVLWKWNIEKEEFSEPRFTRSAINSCSSLNYYTAHCIINDDKYTLDHDFEIVHGYKTEDIRWRLLLLNNIAKNLRAKRFENGALSINNPKIEFPDAPGEPKNFVLSERWETNFLIEEFMLLANQAAAKLIYDHFPDKSILRCHSPPSPKLIKKLKDRLNNVGLELDISSSKSIHESMQRLIAESNNPKAVEVCLSALLTKAMARASYFCSEGKTNADLRHYGLSVPIYTHFTSPLRRYPDVLVHRLLAAILNYEPPPQKTAEELHKLAEICNEHKLKGRKINEECTLIYFKRYIERNDGVIFDAVVSEIYSNMLNVILINGGLTIPVVYSKQNWIINKADAPNSILISETKTESPTKLQIFSVIEIEVVVRNKELCGFFY